MSESNNNAALRKRQQIQNANRNMFMWVAIAAAVVGIAGVLSVSLVQRLIFNQKVIATKAATVSTLSKNLATVEGLKNNVRLRNTDEALVVTPRIDDREPISVILDALPSQPNSSALGASLQQNLLDKSGVRITQLDVRPVTSQGGSLSLRAADTTENEISFVFTLNTSANRLRDLGVVLRRIERSIRVVDITSLTIDQQSDQVTLTAEGRAFYEPERKVELTEKAVRP